jgi:hypothetical protein
LAGTNHAEAGAINRRKMGRGLSQQAFHIELKIKRVDDEFAPDCQQPAPAIVAVITWVGLSYLLGRYFRHFENLDKTYGPLGAAIGLYVWFYLSGFAILLGGEINFLLGELRDHRTLQSSTPVRSQSRI